LRGKFGNGFTSPHISVGTSGKKVLEVILA